MTPSHEAMSDLSLLLHQHHRRTPEQTLCELRGIFELLALHQGLLMDSLARLQAAAGAQADLISAAQTRINTLEAAIGAEGGQADTVPASEVDKISAQLEASNASLKALVPDNGPTTAVNSSDPGADTPETLS